MEEVNHAFGEKVEVEINEFDNAQAERKLEMAQVEDVTKPDNAAAVV